MLKALLSLFRRTPAPPAVEREREINNLRHGMRINRRLARRVNVRAAEMERRNEIDANIKWL